MKYVLEVCLIALAAGSFVPPTAAQALAMQQGISVELVPTHNASAVPDADGEDAFIATVTENSLVYLGVNLITLPELAEKARSTPFKRGQAIYIKADARTPYATVSRVLQATGGPIPQVLLTSQPASAESSTIVPPEGLNVSVGSTFPSGTVATVVQLFPSLQGRPLLKINNDEISWSALESTLRRHFQKGDEKTVLLRADTRLPFADVVHAVDACRAAGAAVHLAAPGI
jgi:biopolymer transport protein ExbD